MTGSKTHNPINAKMMPPAIANMLLPSVPQDTTEVTTTPTTFVERNYDAQL